MRLRCDECDTHYDVHDLIITPGGYKYCKDCNKKLFEDLILTIPEE